MSTTREPPHGAQIRVAKAASVLMMAHSVTGKGDAGCHFPFSVKDHWAADEGGYRRVRGSGDQLLAAVPQHAADTRHLTLIEAVHLALTQNRALKIAQLTISDGGIERSARVSARHTTGARPRCSGKRGSAIVRGVGEDRMGREPGNSRRRG